jgi:hypothetical protein
VQGTRGEGPAVGRSANEVRGSVIGEIRSASAGDAAGDAMEVSSVIREVCKASEGDVKGISSIREEVRASFEGYAKGISSVIGEIRAASAGDAMGVSSIRVKMRAASAGINSVRREAREGRVEARPTTPRTKIEAFQDLKSSSSPSSRPSLWKFAPAILRPHQHRSAFRKDSAAGRR